MLSAIHVKLVWVFVTNYSSDNLDLAESYSN